MRIAGLARANEKDLERCYDAVRHAPLHRIHTFLASSDIHLEHKLGISRTECLEISARMVAFAKALGVEDIEFSPEDAGRSDPHFLVDLCGAVIEAGATTINLPDTVGYTLPAECGPPPEPTPAERTRPTASEPPLRRARSPPCAPRGEPGVRRARRYGGMFEHLLANTAGGERVIWSTHCHNDLGLATANSLAAVQKGARQVEVAAGSPEPEASVFVALSTRP